MTIFAVLLLTYAFTGNKLVAEFCRLAPEAIGQGHLATLRIQHLLCSAKVVDLKASERTCHAGALQNCNTTEAALCTPRTATFHGAAQQSVASKQVCDAPVQQSSAEEARRITATFLSAASQLVRRMLMVLCSPLLVSYATGDWFFFFSLATYAVLLALLTIQTTSKCMAAAPACKDTAFAVVRLGKPLLALLVVLTPADPQLLPLRMWGSSGLPARWKLWASLAWFACMVQVALINQLWLGLLEWLAWEWVRHSYAATLAQPQATPQELLQGCLICYVLPTLVGLASDVYLARQFDKACKQSIAKAKVSENEGEALIDAAAEGAPSPSSPRTSAAAGAPAQASGCQRAVNIANQGCLGSVCSGSVPSSSSPLCTPAEGMFHSGGGNNARAPAAPVIQAHLTSAAAAAAAAAVRTGSSSSGQPLYHSPLKHTWLAVKVHSPPDVPFAEAAKQVTAAARTAIAAAGGQYKTTLIRHVCIPGCVLFMGDLVWDTNQHQHQHQQQDHQRAMQEVLLGDIPAADGDAAFSDGAWRLQCREFGVSSDLESSSSSSSSGSSYGHEDITCASNSCSSNQLFLKYDGIESLEGAVDKRLLQAAVGQAVQAVSGSEAAGGRALEVVPAIVATWDRELQLQLVTGHGGSSTEQQGYSGCLDAGKSKTGTNDNSSSSNSNCSSGMGCVVRVVVAQDGKFLWDQQPQLQPVGRRNRALGLSLPPPASICSSSRSSDAAAAVLSLFILPAEATPCSGRRGGIQAWAPLARVTVLLLPSHAAAEIQGCLQQHQLSQLQVAPLLQDLALLLGSSRLQEPERLTTSDGAAAALAMPFRDSSSQVLPSRSGEPGGTLGLSLMALLGQGMMPYLHAYGWEGAAGLVSAHVRQLLQGLEQMVGPPTEPGRAADAQGAREPEPAAEAAPAAAAKVSSGERAACDIPLENEAARSTVEEPAGSTSDDKVAAGMLGAGRGTRDPAALCDQSVRAASGLQRRGGSAGGYSKKGSGAAIKGSSGGSDSSIKSFKSCSTSGSTGTAAAPVPLLDAEEAAAVTGWKLKCFWLCCKGFSVDVEAVYLGFKARHFQLLERSFLVIQLVAMLGFWCRYLWVLPGWFKDPYVLIAAGVTPLVNKLPLLMIPAIAPQVYSHHRELLLLAGDLLGVLGAAYTKRTVDVSILRQLYSPRQIILIPMLRQVLMPLRPPAALVRWALLCPFMVSHALCTWWLVCPSAEWASAHPIAAAVGAHGVLLLGSLVLSLITDLVARRAFVRILNRQAGSSRFNGAQDAAM